MTTTIVLIAAIVSVVTMMVAAVWQRRGRLDALISIGFSFVQLARLIFYEVGLRPPDSPRQASESTHARRPDLVHLKALGQATPLQRLVSDFHQPLLAVRAWLAEHEPRSPLRSARIAAATYITSHTGTSRACPAGCRHLILTDALEFILIVGGGVFLILFVIWLVTGIRSGWRDSSRSAA